MATGNIAPSRNITGAATTINCPGGIWLDSSNDSLYVMNAYGNSILVFTASTANGNVAPARTIAGAATTLGNNYGQLWLDAASDRLYVANYGTNAVLVFVASTANGNVAPVRSIVGAATLLSGPYGIWLSANNSVYHNNFISNTYQVRVILY
jgi:DNA-binding beta-propeller fold protein YncE